MKSYHKIIFGIAAACLLAFLAMAAMGKMTQAGPFIICFFIALAIAFRGSPALKGFAYTVMIFAAVTTALYYPRYLLS